MQRRFLHELGLSDTEAFVRYNFAPPSVRRRLALLGFLHKRVLHQCHPMLLELLPSMPGDAPRYGWRTRQLEAEWKTVIAHRRLYERSLYAYILMYNRLPQVLVDVPTVSGFQRKLTRLCKETPDAGDSNWRLFCQDCGEVVKFFYA